MAKEIIHTTKQLYIDMGSRLRQERVRLNYTQEQIAEVLNMSTAWNVRIWIWTDSRCVPECTDSHPYPGEDTQNQEKRFPQLSDPEG